MAKRKRGRPKGPKKVSLNLHMRPKVVAALKKAAADEEIPPSEYVERVLKRRLHLG